MSTGWAGRLLLAVGLWMGTGELLLADIPFLWLDAPTRRDNPHDPKSPLYRPPTMVPLAFPSSTFSPSFTPSPSASLTPTISFTPTVSLTPSFSPTFSASPTVSDTFSASPTSSDSPTETPFAGSPTSTSTPSPSVTPTPGLLIADFNAGDMKTVFGLTAGAGDDNVDEGCGSTSNGAISTAPAGPDLSQRVKFDLVLGAGGGCGYWYAYGYVPLAAPNNDLSAYGALTFDLKGAVGGEQFAVTIKRNSGDACTGGNNSMRITFTASASWTTVVLPYASFTDKNGGCPFVSGGSIAAVSAIIFDATNSGSISLEIDNVGVIPFATTPTITPSTSSTPSFTATPSVTATVTDFAGSPTDTSTPSPSATPTLTLSATPTTTFLAGTVTFTSTPSSSPSATSTPAALLLADFNGGSLTTAFGDAVGVGDDNADEGCGSASSSAIVSANPGMDATDVMQSDMVLGSSGGACGYWYTYLVLPFSSPNNDFSAYSSLSFDVKGSVGGEQLVVRFLRNSDPCLGGGQNRLSHTFTATSSWATLTYSFSSFTNKNGGCPFVSGGSISQVTGIMVESLTNGPTSVQFDNFRLLP